MRVLVVDDDTSLRAVVRVALAQAEVWEAADGVAALDTLAMSPVEVVLLDVMMPGISGFEVLSRIRRDPGLADVRVVMLTARAGEDDHLVAFRAGADAYLTKPFDIEQLESVVNEVAVRTPGERQEAREAELRRAQLLRQIEHSFDF